MCGISGIIELNRPEVDSGAPRRMADAIRHRGPDDEGYLMANHRTNQCLIVGGVDTPDDVYKSAFPYSPRKPIGAGIGEGMNMALANRRLAILDLSPAGHQPMCNGDRTLWIVHNGEIYNFREIRIELEALGHSFKSRSDTEVILHAYDQWGADCVQRFNGMWAFCIWDTRAKKLFCSRDRFGIKPFYYVWDGQSFLFASEIKSIIASGRMDVRANDAMVHDYLAFGRIDHTDETFFLGIKQLRGGHWLELELESGNFNIHQYYDIPIDHKRNRSSSQVYAEEFRQIFEDSVRSRLVSDVPVGACLSGGLDSSSIVCMMSALVDGQQGQMTAEGLLKSFSARHDDPRHDEGQYIRSVVEKTGIDAHMVYPTVDGIERELDDLIWHQEQPFGSTSIYAQWTVFDSARQAGVKVILDGQGADESLGGYPTYNRDHLASLLRSGKFSTLYREAQQHHGIHGVSWFKMLAGMALYASPEFLHKPLKARLRRRQSNWLDRGFVREFGDLDRYDWVPLKTNVFDHALYRSFHLVLPSLLRYEDRNSMAHSLESRLPFLDYRLVEWLFSTPIEVKINNGTTKSVLREAMKGVLPEPVRNRRSKIGFSTPEDQWMRGQLKPFILEMFDSDSFKSRPYFDHKAIRRSFDSHLGGHSDISTVIWTWINLELWLRRFVD